MLFLSTNQIYYFCCLRKFNTISSIGILARFNYPNFIRLIFLFSKKSFELGILWSFNIISFWNVIKWVSF